MSYPFWVNDFDRVKNFRDKYPGIEKIFQYPMSFWYGERNGKGSCGTVHKSVQRLLNRADPFFPVFVIYNMPYRDMGHYSKGGAKDQENYMEFLGSMCSAISDRPVFLIYEPDAVPHSTLMSQADSEWRLNLMRESLAYITQNCAARVYIDIGHSNWLEPSVAGNILQEITNPDVAGFSVNVSNYRSTSECIRWAHRVGEYTMNKQFVVDTSRNGNGPYGNEWCNPPGRCLGIPPTTDTGDDLCDAFLWIKVPGESDGKCNGGPRAGRFWPEYAQSLVENTPWLND